ncbi:proteasome accessory factor PafA2 family protein [Bifidobacterium choloepi]|uniref:Pup--protein ligase n=1 Tax=Bifidobacterium choloepi TaxID=2614131 RepID=A0A6I5MYV1_9BIFI|nr:proteasome accessory factor PafA2 family protein [Bifidobacterium choloepi]NEG69386.1 Pup--protein ligase [Bifidobacterium choloepi]
MPQLHDSSSRTAANRSAHYADHARIFGLETEHGISVTGANRTVTASEAAMEMFRPVVERARSTNTYVDNGSRLYLDVGAHPEYATAEARTPLDALLADLAGERTMASMGADAQAVLRRKTGTDLTVHLFRNNVDSVGHSFGCHENYLVRRYVDLAAINDQLLPFLISRQIYTGAGRFAHGRFGVTQRAEFVDETVSSATTRSRPMVNTRDEPHANPEDFRRLHVIIGDTNRSQWATTMKLGTTHLVLCLIEAAARHEYLSGMEKMALADPVAANLMINDFGGRSALHLANGTTLTALEMQEHYLAAAEAFVERFPQEAAQSLGESWNDSSDGADAVGGIRWILDQWRWILGRIEERDWPAMARKVDWTAKATLFVALAHKQGFEGLRDPRLASSPLAAKLTQLDMDYHDIANGTLYPALVRRGMMTTLVTDSQVDRAVREPPSGTRAVLRGRFVRAARDAAPDVRWTCDWTDVAVTAPVRASAILLDPFSAEPTADYDAVMAALG